MSRILPVLLVSILIWSGAAHAADRFISPKGSDGTNDCSDLAAPCRTLGHALAQGVSGDVIKAAKGKYKENVAVSSGTWTIMGGYAAATFSEVTRDVVKNKTEFSGGKTGTFLQISSPGGLSMKLDGLTIAGSVTPGSGGGIAVEATGGIVELMLDRVTLAKNRAAGFGGGIALRAGDFATLTLLITNSAFAGNRAGAAGGALSAGGLGTGIVTVSILDSRLSGNVAASQGGAIDLFGARESGFTALTARRSIFDKNKAGKTSSGGAIAVNVDAPSGEAWLSALALENCILQNNTAGFGSAMSLDATVGEDAPSATATINARLINNTITANKKAFAALDIAPINFSGSGTASVNTSLQNNIVHGNAGVGIATHVQDAESFMELTLTTNNIDGIASTVVDPAVDGVNSVVTADPDPQLNVDPGLVKKSGIFRLAAGSQMIGQGTCDDAPAEDFEGDARPSGTGVCGSVDIGADQFVP